jgi:hypothetical protein
VRRGLEPSAAASCLKNLKQESLESPSSRFGQARKPVLHQLQRGANLWVGLSRPSHCGRNCKFLQPARKEKQNGQAGKPVLHQLQRGANLWDGLSRPSPGGQTPKFSNPVRKEKRTGQAKKPVLQSQPQQAMPRAFETLATQRPDISIASARVLPPPFALKDPKTPIHPANPGP